MDLTSHALGTAFIILEVIGTIRDLLIGQVPVSWIIHLWPVFVAFGTAVIVIAVLRWRPHADLVNRNPIMLADAAGLGAFVIVGASLYVDFRTFVRVHAA